MTGKEVSCENCAFCSKGREYGEMCYRFNWEVDDPKETASSCANYVRRKEMRFKLGKPEKLEFEL